MGRMGRPRAKIKGTEVQKLASYWLTNTEIADFFGVNESTIRRSFAEFLTKGRAIGKMKLRRKQMQRAMQGSDTMLVWLGKNILGQTEKIKSENKETIKIIRKTLK